MLDFVPKSDTPKILFISPPYHAGVVEVAGRWLPLPFVYLAAVAREKGWDVQIYDAMSAFVSHQDILNRIEEWQPDIVATSAITATFPDAMEMMAGAKRLGALTLIGGVHPSFMWKETLDFEGSPVDIVAIGEAEDTLADILDVLVNKGDLATVAGVAYLKDGVAARTAIRPRSLEIPERPMAWDLLDWSLYTYFVYPGSRLAAISTSRGCSHSCTFCSQQKFWEKSWRGREATPVVDELELLAKTYKVDVVLFTDEYPTPDRERWEALLDAIIERDLGMKILIETRAEDIVRDEDILSKYVKAGIVHVYVGLEATDQERLDLIKKDNDVQTGIRALELLTEYGILSETSFVLGFPDETPEKVARTLELSKMYAPDFAHYLAIAPWPYADMWDDLKDHVVVHDYRRYNLVDPVVKPIAMSLDDIDNAIVDCYRSFYTHKMIVMATDKNPERKDYLLRSMKLIMGSSFVRKKMMGGKGMPPEMRELLKKLGVVKERPASAAVGESKGTADL